MPSLDKAASYAYLKLEPILDSVIAQTLNDQPDEPIPYLIERLEALGGLGTRRSKNGSQLEAELRVSQLETELANARAEIERLKSQVGGGISMSASLEMSTAEATIGGEKKGMSEDEASAKISAGMKGMHTRKQLKEGNTERYQDGDRAAKIEARRKRIREGNATEEDTAVEEAVKQGMSEDEAAAKITAGMKGMHTRKQLKEGNTERFQDNDRAAKIEARKKRIADGAATEEDKAVEEAVKQGMTEDEAAAKITAGMKGMHTRKQLKEGNTERFQDAERAEKIAAKKAKDE